MRLRRRSATRASSDFLNRASELILAVSIFTIFSAPVTADALPVADGGFGTDGSVQLESYSPAFRTGAVTQPDRRIVVGAESGSGPGLLRLNEDGSIDKSFGTDGWVSIPPTPPTDESFHLADMLRQPDGSIITGWEVVGEESDSFAFVRVDGTGSLDTSFGDDGLVTVEGVTSGWSLGGLGGMALQPDGKIVAVGTQLKVVESESILIGLEDGVVFRFQPNGLLDTSFGAGGVFVHDVSDTDGFADVVLAPSGEILIGGYVGEGWERELETEPTNLTVVRLTVDGQLDPSFGNNGAVSLDVLDDEGVVELTIQGQNRIVASGNAGEEFGPQKAVVARWTWDGSPDATFGTDGAIVYDNGDGELPFEQIAGSVIQRDHKIIVVGSRVAESSTTFMDRLNQDGSPDTSFGEAGRFVLDDTGPRLHSIALDPADRIVATGRQDEVPLVMRFFNDVAFDGRRFSDDDLNPFEGDIAWIAGAGITRGCNPPANTLYCPDRPVTRGEVAAFFTRALGLTDPGLGDLFDDDDGSVFEGDIDRLATAGITRGCNPPANNLYCPDRPVTRGEVAAFLTRALGLTDPGLGDLFDDDDGSVFEGDIDRLATAGITRGCNPPANTNYCPRHNVTRAQLAAFLRRGLG